MASKDYYKILGVEENASTDQIHKAFRSLAKKHHPDRNKGDQKAEEKFKEIGEAHDVLGDKKKREEYDTIRKYGGSFGGFGGASGAGYGGGGFPWSGGTGGGSSARFGEGGFGFEDLFGSMFEGGEGSTFRSSRSRRGPSKGRDTISRVKVPFETAATGGAITIFPDNSKSRLKVKIPKGIEDGTQIRLAGKGEPGRRGGASGDLLLEINIAPDPRFKREGLNLVVEEKISAFEAMLGTSRKVSGLKGSVSVKIPPGSQHGSRLRIPGWGIENTKGLKGDLFVQINIIIPENLSKDQIELLEKAAGM